MAAQRIPSGETYLTDTYFRVSLKEIRFTAGSREEYADSYALYLEKGLQVYGKSTAFAISNSYPKVLVPIDTNKFDFQVFHDKNLNYTWALYSINAEGYEERLETKNFNIKSKKDEYFAGGCKNNKECSYSYGVAFPTAKIEIDFVLMIQNTSENIVALTKQLLDKQATPENSQLRDDSAIDKKSAKESAVKESAFKKSPYMPIEEKPEEEEMKNAPAPKEEALDLLLESQPYEPPTNLKPPTSPKPRIASNVPPQETPSPKEEETVDEFDKMIKEKEKQENYRKLQIVLLLLVLLVGLLGSGVISPGRKAGKKAKFNRH